MTWRSVTTMFALVALSVLQADAHSLDPKRTLQLPIPARRQAPDSPKSGWCGETAIQEALLYYGVWAPQRLINRAGNPKHPDLYSSEIPAALNAFNVRFEYYQPKGRGFHDLLAWDRAAIDAGDPVFAGVKILPTQHPAWGLDHFVLVVGYGPKGLLVNTTWGYQQWADDTPPKGISFKHVSYAIRLRGIALPYGAIPARLSVIEETEDTVRLRATCAGLSNGATYRFEQRGAQSRQPPSSSAPERASGGRIEQLFTVRAGELSRFSCRLTEG